MKDRPAKTPYKRPLALWVCAAMLGSAAGINYVRMRPQEDPVAKEIAAKNMGLRSADDFSVFQELVDKPLERVNAKQLEMINATCRGDGKSLTTITFLLAEARNDAVAKQLAPSVQLLGESEKKYLTPEFNRTSFVVSEWKKRGINVEALGLAGYLKP